MELNKGRIKPHNIVLALLWFITCTITIYLLILGVRNTDQYQGLRYVMHTAYVLSLIWFLTKLEFKAVQHPDIKPFIFPRWKYGKVIPVIFVFILLFLNVLTDQVDSLILLILVFTTIVLLFIWRKEVNIRVMVTGIFIGIIAFFAGQPFIKNGLISGTGLIIYSSLTPLIYITGSLIQRRAKIGGIQLADGNYCKALKSFIAGCMLFIPLGLINAADGSPGTDLTWVNEAWIPFSLPLFSGIVEETRYRLLLVSLCYYLLRPAFSKYPVIPVLIAVLFSAITFGLGHGWTLERLFTTGLLYGLPMAITFVRLDWEHAVGAHYMVNFIPWTAVYFSP